MGVVLGSSLSRLQGQKGGSVSGLRHSRVILLPGAKDSVWEKQESHGTGQGEGLTWRVGILFTAGSSGWISFALFASLALSLAERPWL